MRDCRGVHIEIHFVRNERIQQTAIIALRRRNKRVEIVAQIAGVRAVDESIIFAGESQLELSRTAVTERDALAFVHAAITQKRARGRFVKRLVAEGDSKSSTPESATNASAFSEIESPSIHAN